MKLTDIVIYTILLFSASLINGSLLKEKDRPPNLLEYYKAKHEATLHYRNKTYDKSFKILDSLYKIYGTEIAIEDLSYEIYVVSAEKSKQNYSRYDAVKFLIEKCGYSLTVLQSKERGLNEVFKKSGIKKSEYLDLKKNYKNSINMDIRRLVKSIIKRDQKYRRGYNGKDLNKKIDSVDRINERILKKIFEKYGYPSNKLIGSVFVDNEYLTLSAVLRHTSDSIRENYFLPKMLHFIKYEGTCPSGIYASIVDQKRVYKGLPPKFKYSNKLSKIEVDQNRYNIGLAPIE